MLNTFQKSRRERIDEMKLQMEDKAAKRDKHKLSLKRKSKNIGKSEKVHKKNKPFMMVKKKMLDNKRDSIDKQNRKKRKNKQFLGHYSKQTKQRIEAKK